MKIFENNDDLLAIYHRSLSLTISKEIVHGKNDGDYSSEYYESEQDNPRRKLLDVERESRHKKIVEAHGESFFKAQVAEKLYTRVNDKVKYELADHLHIFNNIIHIETAISDTLDILAVKVASIKRISPMINSLPWLADELIKLVNKPQYRKRADVQMTDPNLALSYIGLDNLKRIIPIFILKNWLPLSTSPFPLMKRRLWNDSLAIAMATSVLAKANGEDEYTAFIAGLFSNIGYYAVTRNVLSTFNAFHLEELKAAYDNKDKKLHDILIKVNSPLKILHQNILEHSDNITANLVEMMPLERIRITEAMYDLAHINSYDKMCTLAKLITKAKAYIIFRNLAKEELIDHDEIKMLFSAAQLKNKELTLIKESNIDQIKLTFN